MYCPDKHGLDKSDMVLTRYEINCSHFRIESQSCSYSYNSSNPMSFYYRTEPSSSGGNNHDRLSDLKIIDQMLKTYDRRATPTNKIGQPTRVECELFIRSFGSISEKTMVRIKNISFFVCLSVFKD